MRLLMAGRSTRQNKIEFVVSAEVINDLCPSRSVPQFFWASRAGVQNHVRSHDLPITTKAVGLFARHSRKLELRGGRSSTNAQWLKQSQIVVDRVHVPHADADEISVKPSACLGLLADPVRGNTSPCT